MTDRRSVGMSFIDPRSMVFWVFAALTAYGLIHIMPLISRSVIAFPAQGFVSSALWIAYGLILATIIYRLELFDRRSPLTMLGAFVWGAVVVAGIGTVAAPAMHDIVASMLGESQQDWVAAFAAPLVEEPLKMLGIVALAFIPGARIRTPMDGLFFGLIVGLGFEVTESLLYTLQGAIQQGGSYTMIVMTFVLRGVVGGLWNHPTFSAITGAGVGYFFGSTASAAKRWAVMLGSLLAAMVLHGFFDTPLFENGNPFITSVVKGLPALLLLVILYRSAQGRERDRFTRTGADSVPSDLISADELDALATRRGRKKARRSERKANGLAAGHALRRLHRSQVELIDSIDEDGTDSERAHEAAEQVREARSILAELGSA